MLLPVWETWVVVATAKGSTGADDGLIAGDEGAAGFDLKVIIVNH